MSNVEITARHVLVCRGCGHVKTLTSEFIISVIAKHYANRWPPKIFEADLAKFKCGHCSAKNVTLARYGESDKQPARAVRKNQTQTEKEIENVEEVMSTNGARGGRGQHESHIVFDHTGYGPGGENFEHDNTGAMMNYSGVADDVYNAFSENEGWEEGYNY